MLFLASLCIGLTLIIKPTFFILGLLLGCLALSRTALRQHLAVHAAIWSAGLLIPSACSLLWLMSVGSLNSFWRIATTIIPLHAELGRRSLGFLLTHSTSPITPLVIAWLILQAYVRSPLTIERLELYAGALLSFISYAEQGKGFPYQRYPLVFFLLFLINTDFILAIYEVGVRRMIAIATLTFECLILAPHSAWLVHSFIPSRPFNDSLAQALESTHIPLNRNVQCLDTFGGCINTLYDMKLVQSSGFLYDCYLFATTQPAARTGRTAWYRADFESAIERNQPAVLVVTNEFCFSSKRDYERLGNLPGLKTMIAERYVLKQEWNSTVAQRWWSSTEYPDDFRLYIRRDLLPTQ